MRQRGRPTSRPIGSATRADFGQTIKPYVILLDSLGQSVSIGIGLVNLAYLYWLAMGDESLRITMFLGVGGLNNSRQR